MNKRSSLCVRDHDPSFAGSFSRAGKQCSSVAQRIQGLVKELERTIEQDSAETRSFLRTFLRFEFRKARVLEAGMRERSRSSLNHRAGQVNAEVVLVPATTSLKKGKIEPSPHPTSRIAAPFGVACGCTATDLAILLILRFISPVGPYGVAVAGRKLATTSHVSSINFSRSNSDSLRRTPSNISCCFSTRLAYRSGACVQLVHEAD